MELPKGFIEMMSEILGPETDDFLRAMNEPPVVSVRVNGRKPTSAFAGERDVKWCDKGYYLKDRPVFTLDPLLHAGAYYVQDASSMIYYEATRRILSGLGAVSEDGKPLHPVGVLDMCAAPGGKTTAIIDALPDGSRVVANEYVGKRAGILRENLIKWGYPDVTVTNRDSSWFAEDGGKYDIVAVDAPCSGEGMMRKEPEAVRQWSEDLIDKCSSLQREILTNAANAVAVGGFLIYSTCTFNRRENEDNAEFIAEELGLVPYDPAFPKEWGIPSGIGTSLPVSRFMPHKTEGEGLFLAIFRKPGEYVRSQINKSAPCLCRRIEPASQACRSSRIKGGKKTRDAEPPEMERILAVDFDKSAYVTAELDRETALAYLRRESIVLPPVVAKGIVIVCYEGLPLGPVKNIGSRANNLYPKNWRILMR